MFDDDTPKLKRADFPRNLENMSVEELENYTEELHAEIERVKQDMHRKKTSRDSASSIFKS